MTNIKRGHDGQGDVRRLVGGMGLADGRRKDPMLAHRIQDARPGVHAGKGQREEADQRAERDRDTEPADAVGMRDRSFSGAVSVSKVAL